MLDDIIFDQRDQLENITEQFNSIKAEARESKDEVTTLEKRLKDVRQHWENDKDLIVRLSRERDELKLNIKEAQSHKQSCTFCFQPHQANTCQNYTTQKERWTGAVELKLCTNCLVSGHSVKECSSRPCKFNGCTAKHHTILHSPDPNNPAIR
jgi:DNA repair exonuclease SbcCD ATPase subunit